MKDHHLRENFIARAKALSKEPEIFRCTLLTSLICESIPFGVCTEADFFDATYGDPAGRDYWKSYLSEPMRVGAFAYVLSVHLNINADQLEWARTAISLALRDAAEAGEPLFIGDTDALLLPFERHAVDFEKLGDVKVRPRAAAKWLLDKPKRQHLVPGSLRDFLDDRSAAGTTQRHLSEKAAERLVREFIDQEKRAGRRPTITGAETAARQANFIGGRDFVRAAFHRFSDVAVKRGRPSKIEEK